MIKLQNKKETVCPHCNKTFYGAGIYNHIKLCEKTIRHKDQIIFLYSNGVSIEKISRELNMDRGAISNILKTNNVKIRLQENGNPYRKYSVNEDFFKNENATMCYILGLVASDGSIKTKNSWSFSQSGENGKNLVNYIKDKIIYNGLIYKMKTIGEDAYSFTVSSSIMVNDLALYNIIERKSWNYTFPQKLNKDNIKYFLRGYLDGDGCIGIYKNNQGIYFLAASFVGTYEFINKCIELIPFKSTFCDINENSKEIRFNGKYAEKFLEWIYSGEETYLSYKYFKYKEFLSNYNPRYREYKKKKEKVLELFNLGWKVAQIEKETNIRFQTIYKWIKNKNEN